MIEYLGALYVGALDMLAFVAHDKTHQIRVDGQEVVLGRNIYRGFSSEPGWEERRYIKTKLGIQETVISGNGIAGVKTTNLVTEKEVKKMNPTILKELSKIPDYIQTDSTEHSEESALA